MGMPSITGIGLAGSGYKLLKRPAIMLDAAEERNHTPISKQANRLGDSLDTMDNPMGDMHSSPKVIMK